MQSFKPANGRHNTRVMAIFQDNLSKPVAECLHCGLYWSKDDGVGNSWIYNTSKAPVKSSPPTNPGYWKKLLTKLILEFVRLLSYGNGRSTNKTIDCEFSTWTFKIQ